LSVYKVQVTSSVCRQP